MARKRDRRKRVGKNDGALTRNQEMAARECTSIPKYRRIGWRSGRKRDEVVLRLEVVSVGGPTPVRS